MADSGRTYMWLLDALINLFASRLGSAVVAGIVSSLGVFGVMTLEPRVVENAVRPDPWTGTMDNQHEANQEQRWQFKFEQLERQFVELKGDHRDLVVRVRTTELNDAALRESLRNINGK